MIKNAKSLIDKSRNMAVKNNITVNEVLQNYMFERILERLSISKYKNNFILKGGLLLSSIMGIDLSIDIATGDLITPREIEYDYKMMFEDRKLTIMSYNIESIIAEKFQTVISRGILNSRMKDYYDLYYLVTYKKFSKDNLKKAIENTFFKRNTDLKMIDEVILEIDKSDFIRELWITYSSKYQYAKNIDFKKIIESFKIIREIIEEEIEKL